MEVEVGQEGGAGAVQGEGVGVGAGGGIQDRAQGAGRGQEGGQGLAQEGGGAGAGLVLREDGATGTKVRFRSGRKAEAEVETGGMIGKMRGGRRRRKVHQQLYPERSQRKTLACLALRLEVPTSPQPS